MASVACKFINSAFFLFCCLISVLGFACCCSVFVFLKAMPVFACLNKLVIFLI
jgi:hypothetical protein